MAVIMCNYPTICLILQTALIIITIPNKLCQQGSLPTDKDVYNTDKYAITRDRSLVIGKVGRMMRPLKNISLIPRVNYP